MSNNDFRIKKMNSEMEFMPIIPLNENDEKNEEAIEINGDLIILPLRNTVLFPSIVLPITVGREKSMKAVNTAYAGNKLIGVLAQKDSNIEDPTAMDLNTIGTVAKILKLIKMPDGGLTVILQGKSRFAVDAFTNATEDEFFKAKVTLLKEKNLQKGEDTDALISNIKDMAGQIISLNPNLPQEAQLLLGNIENPTYLLHFAISNLSNDLTEKQQLLEDNDPNSRAKKLLTILGKELQFAELKNKVNNKARTEIDKQQREYFLQQQLNSIKDELGDENNGKEIAEMKAKAEKKNWPDTAKTLFFKGIAKLERMHPNMPDYSVIYNHCDLMLDLPWNEVTEDNYNLNKAKKVLDADHYGMQKIKTRIIEYLAVLKLKGDMKSPIICFVGPPGIGKTSLGRSIASAMNRKYTRLSLGGLHDESELRGHRKTYIGAMPGRIVQNLRKVQTSNPVMILDEIDKIGADHRGDPSSALLEILDPEQNHSFYDNYLETEYDLSKVLFIATANSLQSIQPALRDRLEIIELNGYAIEEKIEIAKRHLIPKQQEAHGLKDQKININDKVLSSLIENFTRESGVRELDRQLASLMRYQAKTLVMKNKIKSTITANDV